MFQIQLNQQDQITDMFENFFSINTVRQILVMPHLSLKCYGSCRACRTGAAHVLHFSYQDTE